MTAAAPGTLCPTTLCVGIDVGSTTVKAVVVDPATRQLLWKDYQRHETRQPEKVIEFLVAIGNAFPERRREDLRLYLTGSGAGPLVEPLGGAFVQEVNAVTLAVEALHPDVGSVVELGGQDAKIIIFVKNEETGERQAITSMNDKCASGTGATIDKCMLKVGMRPDELVAVRFDPARLHHVASKCGVFAETDVVNLVKSGIPGPEVMNSLADAIVHQNLAVLTRGRTLRSKVLLLGGPNTYLPFLRECWRLRIPETWDERGYEYDRTARPDELIVVPEDAQYYAAFGAVVYGLRDGAGAAPPVYRGLEPLRDYASGGRSERLVAVSGPPLVRDRAELEAFEREYTVPLFDAPPLAPGQVVRAVIGLDGGSTSSKAVLVGEDGAILRKAYRLSRGNPIQDAKELLAELKAQVEAAGATLECLGFGATGYAAAVLEKSLRADVNIVETVAHTAAARAWFPDADVVCDIGGQDIKVLFLQRGEIKDFKLSNQCSAGNGMLLQAMADQFGVPITRYSEVAFDAALSPKFSYGCAVFLDSDRVNFQKEGYKKEELLAGLALVLPKNVWQYVVGVPRLAELGTRFVLQGGTQKNLAAVKAQVDYIRERVPGAEVHVHPHCGEAGAIGAAMETLRVVTRRGSSTFVGLDAAIDLAYTTRNDESTRCTFCPNNCSRTFIDAATPDGQTSRYISGFSCEKGTVESKAALKAQEVDRRRRRAAYPNLVELEGELAFKRFLDPAPLPRAGAPVKDVEVTRGLLGRVRRREVVRGFRRSSPAAAARRARLKIGLPRVLNMYSTGPLWRTYFEALGVLREHVVWSDPTSEEMYAEGGKYGSVDPCYPSKCNQAHIHDLLFHKHTAPRTGPLDYIFFPCITHVPTFVSHVMDSAACPIVAGAPKVIRAAFTKEVDFFARAGVEYVDAAVTLTERHLFEDQLWQAWGARLDVTRDEHDHAVAEGWRALDEFERRLQERGREVLEQVEREGRLAVLVLNRPYHADPGLHHGIPDELQALGYPILSIRSIPKDPAWLARFFQEDVASGRVADPLDIRDVWPENYSANSVMKVWAARFAARHPNVALLDLSSFKCGHDAPTYGLIDSIAGAGRTPRLVLHDIDANKPGGSIAIRTKTFGHTLARRQEELDDLARKKRELLRRLEARRRALLGLPPVEPADEPATEAPWTAGAPVAVADLAPDFAAEPTPGDPSPDDPAPAAAADRRGRPLPLVTTLATDLATHLVEA
jgi:predicted CoA-substrate-specific enzyme activase